MKFKKPTLGILDLSSTTQASLFLYIINKTKLKMFLFYNQEKVLYIVPIWDSYSIILQIYLSMYLSSPSKPTLELEVFPQEKAWDNWSDH